MGASTASARAPRASPPASPQRHFVVGPVVDPAPAVHIPRQGVTHSVPHGAGAVLVWGHLMRGRRVRSGDACSTHRHQHAQHSTRRGSARSHLPNLLEPQPIGLWARACALTQPKLARHLRRHGEGGGGGGGQARTCALAGVTSQPPCAARQGGSASPLATASRGSPRRTEWRAPSAPCPAGTTACACRPWLLWGGGGGGRHSSSSKRHVSGRGAAAPTPINAGTHAAP